MEIKLGSTVAIKRLSPNGVVIGYDLGEVQEIEQIEIGKLRYRVARDGVSLGSVFEDSLDLSVMSLLGCIPEEPATSQGQESEEKVDENEEEKKIDPSQDPTSPSVEFDNQQNNGEGEASEPVDPTLENTGDDPSDPRTETPSDPVDPSLQNGENPNAPEDPSNVNPEA